MSFFGPTLGQLGADPNSPAITGSPAPIIDTSGTGDSGVNLNTLGGFFGIIGSTVGNVYRAVNTPTGPTALPGTGSYLLPNGSAISPNPLSGSSGTLLIVGLLAVLLIVALRVFKPGR